MSKILIADDEPERVGIVGVAQESDLLRLVPLLELGFADGGNLVEVAVQVLGMRFKCGVVHAGVFDVIRQNAGEQRVRLIEVSGTGLRRDDCTAQRESAQAPVNV